MDLAISLPGRVEILARIEPGAYAVLLVLLDDKVPARHNVHHPVDRFLRHPGTPVGFAHLRPASALILRPKTMQNESIRPRAMALLVGISPAAIAAPVSIPVIVLAAIIEAIVAISAI